MSSIVVVSALVLGFLHGFVVWNLLFRTVRVIAKRITPEHGIRLPVAEAVAHVVVVLFLLVCAILLLDALGSIVSDTPSRELKGYLFVGSFAGWLASGLIPKIEAGYRGRGEKPRDPSET